MLIRTAPAHSSYGLHLILPGEPAQTIEVLQNDRFIELSAVDQIDE